MARTRTVRALAVGLTLIAAACGGEGDAPSETSTTASRTITVGYTSTAGLGDLFTFVAWEQLGRQGIEVRPKFFSGHDVELQALARGDIDIATNVATDAVLFAVNDGVPIKVIAGYTGPEFVLAGLSQLSDASDLVGKRVGVHSLTGGSGAWVRAYLESNDVDPGDVNILEVPGSGSRAQAMVAGELDAASVGQDDMVFLEDASPGKFHVITPFGIGFGGEGLAVTVTSTELIESDPDVVQAVVTELMKAARRLTADEEFAKDKAFTYLGNAYEEVDTLHEAVAIYVENGLYPVNGALSSQIVEDYLAFTRERNPDFADVELGAVEEYYDLTFVEAALEELGTQ